MSCFLRCPLTNPKFKALDATAVIFGDIFRVALGQQGDLLLDLTDIFLRILKIDLLDRNDFLGYIVDTSRGECSMVERVSCSIRPIFVRRKVIGNGILNRCRNNWLCTRREGEYECLCKCVCMCASVVVCVRGNMFECLSVYVYDIDGMFFGQ